MFRAEFHRARDLIRARALFSSFQSCRNEILRRSVPDFDFKFALGRIFSIIAPHRSTGQYRPPPAMVAEVNVATTASPGSSTSTAVVQSSAITLGSAILAPASAENPGDAPPAVDPPVPSPARSRQEEEPLLPAEAPQLPAEARRISTGVVRALMQSVDLAKKGSMMALKAYAPANKSRCRKVPPHYLAVGNWREVALNIRYFQRNLSREQQVREWKRFNLLSLPDKKTMHKRIKELMANRTLCNDVSSRPLSERVLVQQSAARSASDSGRELAARIMAEGAASHESVGGGRGSDEGNGCGGGGGRGRGRGGRGSDSGNGRGGRGPRQPRVQHEAARHVGYGSTDAERENAVQQRTKEKSNCRRKIGVPAKSIGEQSDAKATKLATRAKRVIAETIDTLSFPGKQPGDPENNLVLVQVNEVEDSRVEGGLHVHKARAKPKLTILASSKETAVKVFRYIGSTVNRAADLQTCEIEWLISVEDQQSLKHTVLDATKRRTRPKKKTKTNHATQSDENAGNYIRVSPRHE